MRSPLTEEPASSSPLGGDKVAKRSDICPINLPVTLLSAVRSGCHTCRAAGQVSGSNDTEGRRLLSLYLVLRGSQVPNASLFSQAMEK